MKPKLGDSKTKAGFFKILEPGQIKNLTHE